jgi:IS1 family transposase
VVLCRRQENAAVAVEALEHQTGRVMAYVFGRRADQAFLRLKRLLTPLGIRRFSPAAGGRIAGTWIHTDM